MTTTPARVARSAVAALLLGVLPFAAGAQKKVEDRLDRIERLLDSGALTEMLNQQDQLRRTLQELQGQVELLERELAEIKKRQHDLYQDTDRRLTELEIATPPTSTIVTAASDDDEQVAEADNESADYQAAFALLKAGQYEEATKAFERFLQRHPKGQYTANALYWLGESYYVVREFDDALPQFQRVTEEHGDSAKAPDALLKIGFIHHEQGDIDQAREVLEQLQKDHPDTTAAALAEQRLNRLGKR